MKLSDALRLGEFALPPVKRWWIKKVDGQICGGCAVGRACYAVGYRPSGKYTESADVGEFMNMQWPWTSQRSLVPILRARLSGNPYSFNTFAEANPVLAYISERYERDNWPIGDIADDIATIEPAPVAIPPLAVERVEVTT